MDDLQEHLDWLHGDQSEPCKCDWEWQSQGRFQGVDMGMGWSRINTHPYCLIHAKCHGFTKELRASGPRWWGKYLYCPVHQTKNCPERTAYKIEVPRVV